MSEPTRLILSVEDNPADARLIEEGVATVGADIDFRVINNGQAAIQQLTGDDGIPPESIDLVFLDLNIPGNSGFDILRLLRGDSAFDVVPVVMVSSSENPEDIRRVYDADANAYVQKPSDPDEFIQTIAAAVRFWIPTPSIQTRHD